MKWLFNQLEGPVYATLAAVGTQCQASCATVYRCPHLLRLEVDGWEDRNDITVVACGPVVCG